MLMSDGGISIESAHARDSLKKMRVLIIGLLELGVFVDGRGDTLVVEVGY